MKKENIEKERYLTVREVGILLNLSTQTIRKMMKAGLIPYFMVGKNYRIKKEDIDRLTERRRENGN